MVELPTCLYHQIYSWSVLLMNLHMPCRIPVLHSALVAALNPYVTFMLLKKGVKNTLELLDFTILEKSISSLSYSETNITYIYIADLLF